MKNSCRTLGLWLLAALAAVGGETTVKTFPLVYEDGAKIDAGGARLRLPYEYRQDGDSPLWFEAERASVLRLSAERGRMLGDNDASGGFSVTWAECLEFHVTIETPGKYTAWYRASYPAKGSWLHFENMDGVGSATISDSQGEVLDRWIWSKGPTYELTKGRHSWNFTPSGWWGGAKLDKVALLKESAAAPTGSGGSLPAPVLKAEVLTDEIRGHNLLQWGALTIDNAASAGLVTVDYSSDHGKTWNALPPDRSLAGVPPELSLKFKLTLATDPTGMTPYITGARITGTVAQVPDLVLDNAAAQFRFSGENGALTGIRNVRTQTEYLAPETASPLFSFTVIRGDYGEPKEIGFGQAELKKITRKPDELRLTYDMMGGGLKVVATIRLESGGIARFSLTVDNRTAYRICRVRFPDLRGLRIGADPADDLLFTPILSGGIAQYPASLRLPRLAYTDRALYYPGMAYMCWMDLWDGQGGGLYVACEDKEYRTTELCFAVSGLESQSFARTGQANPPTGPGDYQRLPVPGKAIDIGYIKDLRIDATTGPVTVPDLLLGVHEGDWHWGADRYREWAQSWMKKEKVPDWLMDTDGWSVGHMTWLGTFAELAKERGRDAAHREKYGVNHPPYPVWYYMAQKEELVAAPMSLNRLLGTEEMFRTGIQKQHEQGHRMMFYLLPPDFAPAFTRDAKRLGAMPARMVPDDEVPPRGFYPEVALRNLDGSLGYPDGIYQDAPVCMGATKWQEYVYHMVVEKYVRQYGADGIYLDGMGLCTYPCANLHHGHRGYGEWLQGFVTLMQRIKKATAKARPGAIYIGEGMGDVENQYLDMGLYYPDNAPQVYRYTIPWSVGSILDVPVGHYTEYPQDNSWYEYITVFGLKAWHLGGNSATELEKREAILSFRQQFSQFQTRAQFRDEVGLRFSEPAIKGKFYTRDEPGTKGALVVFFNDKLKDGATATLAAAAAGTVRAAWVFTLGGQSQPLAYRNQDGQLTFTIPAARLSAALFLERCEPFIELAHIAPVVPGESGVAIMTVHNLESTPISGDAALRLPKGWKSQPQQFQLAGGQSQTFTLPFTVSRGCKYDVYDVYGVVREAKRETTRCLPMGVCRPVQAEMFYVTGDTIQVEMENSSDKSVAGVCRLTPPAGVTVMPPEAPFSLTPHGTGVLTFALGNLKSVTTREFIKATLAYGKDETVAFELVQPPLLNGGFEQDTAGDGIPDYYNYRTASWLGAPGVALDRSVFAEGRQSLRLDPDEKAVSHSLNTTFVRLVPNRKYRLSCQVRRSANHSGIGVHLFSMSQWSTVKPARVTIGNKASGPVDTWEMFSAEFVTPNILVPHQLILGNSTKGVATVWFDDIHIDELGPAK